MARSLIVFSDGTGQRGGASLATNVWRLYKMIDRRDGDQLTFYDDGVGTQRSTPYRALSAAFGLGITANVMQAYEFIAKNYEEGSEIYLFGFSRGAYTVRLLLGLLKRIGLIDGRDLREEEFAKTLVDVKHAFRSNKNTISDNLSAKVIPVDVEFIGVWDTVDAVGVPVDELKPIVTALPRLFGRRQFGFTDRTVMGAKYARHALAIDDERRSFHPNYWNAAGTWGDGQKVNLRQVWFTGMHTNVGGGYPKDGLAYVALEWMIAELMRKTSIKLLASEMDDVTNSANEADKVYDSRSGLGVFYRYAPRRLARFPTGHNDFYRRKLGYTWSGLQEITVHISVWLRVIRNVQEYAPLFINTSEINPSAKVNMEYTDLGGSLFHPAKIKPEVVEKGFPSLPGAVTKQLTRLVATRQIFHVFFLLFLVAGVAFGLTMEVPNQTVPAEPSLAETLMTWLAETLKGLVPAALEPIIDNAFARPLFGLGFTFLVLFNYLASRLFARKINSTARAGWNRVVEGYFDEEEELERVGEVRISEGAGVSE